MPRKLPSGPHADFIAWWMAEYQRTQATPYAFVGGRDGTAVKRLLALFPADELRKRAVIFLETSDAWISQTDRSLAILACKINTPILRGIAAKPTSLSIETDWLAVTGAFDLAARDDYDGANGKVGPRLAATVKAAGGWSALRRATSFEAQRAFRAAASQAP